MSATKEHEVVKMSMFIQNFVDTQMVLFLQQHISFISTTSSSMILSFFICFVFTLAQPTQFPTRFPSASPTQVESFRLLYKLVAGSQVIVQRNSKNITYSNDDSVPTNITIVPLDNPLVAVAWENLEYRVWDVVSNETTTEVLADPCNPGHPSEIPGTLITQVDGVYACPTIQKCILTDDCTDELAPYSDYSQFPDLRACWCSYDEIEYPGTIAPDLTVDVEHDLQLFGGTMTVNDPRPDPSNILGPILCNNFIDREINCQFFRSNPEYEFQCEDEPIKCYSQTLGKFFGGFYNQNPKYLYGLNYDEWTLAQYVGIASVMNNLTYSTNGVYVDPFTPQIWTDYLWINSSASTGVVTADAVFDIGLPGNPRAYQVYTIQSDPYLYMGNGKPPPPIDFQGTFFPSIEEAMCIEEAIASGPTPVPTGTCDAITWNADAVLNPAYTVAGLEYAFNLETQGGVLSVQVTFTTTTPDITGIEVFDAFGGKCGSVYPENGFVEGDVFVFLCLELPGFEMETSSGSMKIRVLGQSAIYDMPQSNLNSQYMETVTDPLFPYLDLEVFQSFSGVTWPLVYPYIYDAGIYTNERKWPQRQRLNTTLLTTIPFTATYNYTTGSSTGGAATAWSGLSQLILTQNVYPENFALRDVEGEFDVAEINFTSPKDLEYLRNIWQVHLAPRFCGADEVQCQTFSFGECIVESIVKQRWYNGDKDATYEFEGKEGGCLCMAAFSTGFFASEDFCQKCASGYGPNTLADMADTIQYNRLISPVYEDDLFPLSTITVSEFEADFICRFPYGVDPVVGSLDSINLCAGHGIVSFVNSTVEEDVVLWEDKYYIACTGLSTDNGTFVLSTSLTEPYTSPFNLMYVLNDNVISVIGTLTGASVYLTMNYNGLTSECVLLCEDVDVVFPLPWTCSLECLDELLFESGITCVNEVFFSRDNVYFETYQDISYLGNRFLLSSAF